MDSNIFSERKPLWISLTVITAVLVLGAVVVFWRSSFEAPAEPAAKIAYCGAELSELCILSFGRDEQGNALINLFVPEEEYPDFYLKVGRAVGEVWFDCVKLEEVPTSVYCLGPALNLNEQLQVELVSQEDNRILAAGLFTVKAVLLVSDVFQFQGNELGTSNGLEDAPLPQGSSTEPAVMPTPQPGRGTPSYPSYP
jgi:hypothetical protein